jgi:hypothetical protein
MAEILEDYEFIGAGSGKYPWDLWLDGQVWKLVRGTDYECTSSSMRTSAQQVGKTRNKNVRTNMIMDGKGIVIQAKGEV